MPKCTQCGNDLPESGPGAAVASISGSIMGDEYTECYYLCDRCGVYTVEVIRDRFVGEEETSFRGPIARAQGDESVALIRSCHEPWNKKCRCAAHRSYFGTWLD